MGCLQCLVRRYCMSVSDFLRSCMVACSSNHVRFSSPSWTGGLVRIIHIVPTLFLQQLMIEIRSLGLRCIRIAGRNTFGVVTWPTANVSLSFAIILQYYTYAVGNSDVLWEVPTEEDRGDGCSVVSYVVIPDEIPSGSYEEEGLQ